MNTSIISIVYCQVLPTTISLPLVFYLISFPSQKHVLSFQEFAAQEDAFVNELLDIGDQDSAFGDFGADPTHDAASLPSGTISRKSSHGQTSDGMLKSDGTEEYKEIGDEGTAPVGMAPLTDEDDRSQWTPEKRACFEWRDTFGGEYDLHKLCHALFLISYNR